MNLPPSPVVGREVSLRLAEESDAAAIFRLRADPRLNRHLSPIGGDVESQREWLRDYKRREKKGEEFYYMIVVAGDDCGAVRLYDFSGDSFTWGSLILDVKNPALALESIALAYRIGFEEFGIRARAIRCAARKPPRSRFASPLGGAPGRRARRGCFV